MIMSRQRGLLLFQTVEVLFLSLIVGAFILLPICIVICRQNWSSLFSNDHDMMTECGKTMCNSSYQLCLTKSEECRNCSDLCATFDDALCLEFCSEYYSNNFGNATQSINLSTWDSYSVLEYAFGYMLLFWLLTADLLLIIGINMWVWFTRFPLQEICPSVILQTLKDIQSKSYLLRFRHVTNSLLIKVRVWLVHRTQ